jgi:hypothetical protein
MVSEELHFVHRSSFSSRPLRPCGSLFSVAAPLRCALFVTLQSKCEKVCFSNTPLTCRIAETNDRYRKSKIHKSPCVSVYSVPPCLS